MKNVLVQGLALTSLTVGMMACSGGGGGGAGGNSTTPAATGALAVPDLNCGASPCLSSGASLMSTSMKSGEELAAYGELVYTQFNTVALPKINQLLYTLETAFKSEGLETCSQIAAVTVGGVQLNSTLNVVITSGGPTSPFGAATTARTFELVHSPTNTKLAVVSIGCSGTVRNLYVRAMPDSTNRFEVWVKSDSANTALKSVQAAHDSGSSKLTLHFVASSASTFELAAAGHQYQNPYGGGAIDFSIAGQANIGVTPKLAHIAYTAVTSQVPPTSYSANDNSWAGTSIRHCYSNLDAGTVDGSGSTCSSLTATFPTVVGVRGNVQSSPITWKVDDLDTAIAVP